MKPFLISPPFGNWINHPNCTRILGSFTLYRRSGLLYHAARSLRRVEGGWINQIGLRNPGIHRLHVFNYRRVYSLVGLEDGDWHQMLSILPPGLIVEVNVGCPNVHRYGISFSDLVDYCHRFQVIMKLPPTEIAYEMAHMAAEAGVTYLHCSNTIPTPHGGISGRQLFEKNLPIVAKITASYPNISVIAGGGIYDLDTVRLYRQAGAKHFSLSTVWFTPWKAIQILKRAA